MCKITTNKGIWTVYGINFSETDSLYSLIQEAINTDNLTDAFLRKISNAPVTVDFEAKTIDFARF